MKTDQDTVHCLVLDLGMGAGDLSLQLREDDPRVRARPEHRVAFLHHRRHRHLDSDLLPKDQEKG